MYGTVMALPVLAENLGPALAIYTAVVLTLTFLAIISLYPALRGHWSAPVLTAPPVLIGLLLLWTAIREGGPVVFWITSILPLALGGMSVGIWEVCRRRNQPIRVSDKPPKFVCDRCGYDLRATPDRCPECGAKVY